jgi:hypothetical protein
MARKGRPNPAHLISSGGRLMVLGFKLVRVAINLTWQNLAAGRGASAIFASVVAALSTRTFQKVFFPPLMKSAFENEEPNQHFIQDG